MSEPRTDTRSVNHKITAAWDRAGTMPAKECVKVHPPDWHWMRDALVALCKERDALATARNDALEEAAKVADKRSAMIKDISPQAAIALLDALPLAIRALKTETRP